MIFLKHIAGVSHRWISRCLLISIITVISVVFARAQGGCHFTASEDVTFSTNGQNTTAGFVTHYLLTDAAGVIQVSQSALPLLSVPAGQYFAYTVNYDNNQTPPTLTTGTNITAIGGDCVDISDPLPLGVCDCNNTTGDLVFSHNGDNASLTTVYLLTNELGIILQSATNTSSFAGLTDGLYNVYVVNYDDSGTAPSWTLNTTSIFQIGGECVDVSGPLGYSVCIPVNCSINSPTITTTCIANDPGDSFDDQFTYTIQVSGTNTGSSFSISGDDTQTNLAYDVDHTFGPFPYSGGALNITLTDSDDGTCELANVVVPLPDDCPEIDTDGDGASDAMEGQGDYDGDGISDFEDFDPEGYLYCQETGEIISGGTITVSPPAGSGFADNDPSIIDITFDGSTGFYQFFLIGGAPSGVYTISYAPPAGYLLSTTRLPQTGSGAGGALDPTIGSPDNPDSDDPLILGSSENGMTGFLSDFSDANNPYYFEIELEAGDPFIFSNNFPLVCPCSLNAPTIVSTCSDNGTPSDPNDDTFTYTIEVTGTDTGATYSISGDDTQSGLSYGVVNGPFGPFPISGSDLTITITDVTDTGCQLVDETVSAPATCSGTCSLNTPTIVSTCSDNGTPSDPNDDTFTYTIEVTGSNTGATYSISGDDTQSGLSYGVVNGPFGPFPISGSDLTITITDVTDTGCQLVDETVSAPATCSGTCSLNTPTIVSTCSDNGTPSDPNDDTFTYTIEVTGSNTGATYSISGDDTQSGLSYGVVNGPFGPFPIGGSDLTITITDVTDTGCQLVDETVSAPATCSGTCSLNTPTIVSTCSDNGTPSDPNDDTFTYTIEVTGTDTGATYSISGDDTQSGLSYGVVNGPFGPFPISGSDLTITITDVTDTGCQLVDETVSAPAACSNTPPCSIQILTVIPTDCDPATNTYDLEVELTYESSPGGNITVNSNNGASESFSADGTGSQTVVLSGLPSDGDQNINVTAFFESDPSCASLPEVYDEPSSCLFDLALIKELNTASTPGPFYPGAEVSFLITVFNQGDVDAYRIFIQDHIPAGLSFASASSGTVTTALSQTATVTSSSAGILTIDQLAAGDQITLEINFRIHSSFSGTSIRNWAEIRAADNDTNPSGAKPVDIDSTPNAANFSENGETDDLFDDNEINGNGKQGSDEDDHDPAEISVLPCPTANCGGIDVGGG